MGVQLGGLAVALVQPIRWQATNWCGKVSGGVVGVVMILKVHRDLSYLHGVEWRQCIAGQCCQNRTHHAMLWCDSKIALDDCDCCTGTRIEALQEGAQRSRGGL